jgi:hypothetical protein
MSSSSCWRRVEPPGGGDAYYYNDTTQVSSWTNPDDGAGGADGGANGWAAIAQLATAATEAALLQTFDAILAAASTPAALAFSVVTSLSLRRKKEVGGAVWTERVAAAYGGMLREMKRVEAAAPSAPPLAPAGVGRALFTRAVSTDNADDVAGGTGGGGENKDEDSAAQPVKTLPRPVYKGDSRKLINLCGSEGSGDVDEARDLIARGINIDEQDEDGQTALLLAALYHRLEMAQELIRAGAALDVQDEDGNTALMIAAVDMARMGLAEEHSEDKWKGCLETDAVDNRLEMAQELIRAGAALDVQNEPGMTALVCAAASNRPEIAQELIRAGAALDVQDKDGDTALMLSVEHDSPELATLLREAGARCPGYKRSGVFNSKCKFCHESKKGHNQ